MVDHSGSAAHGFPRARGGHRGVPVRERRVGWGDRLDEVALRREAIQETLLVLDAALSQHIGAWVVVQRRRLELPECDGSPQAREVAAADMSAEVGGRERELAIGVAHGAGR